MTPARRPVRKSLMTRFSLLIYFLLLIVNSVWFLLIHFGAVHAEPFIIVVNFVLFVIAVLCGLIFIEPVFQYIKDRVQRVKELEDEIARATEKIQMTEGQLKDEQQRLLAEQQQARDEKQLVEYVLSRMTEGLIVFNKQKQVVVLNKAAEEITGLNQFDVAQKQIGEVIKVFEGDREIVLGEEFFKKRVRLETPQMKGKTVDVIGVQLPLIQVQDLGYMVILHDLTDRVEVEKGVEKKLSDILASFARELKQPYSVLPIVLENLYTASAIENGTITFEQTSVDISQVIKNAVGVCAPVAQERQIALQFTEPTDGSIHVKGDQNRIYQIVLNLLVNAIYYTLADGSITISIASSEHDITVWIQDTGIGIPTASMPQVFMKYGAGIGGKGLEGGIGVGLYVCKKLVELQGGKIWLDSVEGRGTVAGLSFPKGG